MSPTHKKSRFWRLCRIYFRRFRITVWLIILALVCCALYLDQVGLPDFVKRPLLEKLRQQGLDLEFSRLRLRRLHELVADKVIFGRSHDPLSPQLTVREAQLKLNHRSLLHFQIEVASLALRQGQLVWPLSASNQAPRHLSVDNIQTHLRFLPGDQWALDNFKADFAGASLQLSGTLTNASAVRDWKMPGGPEPTPAGLWQKRLNQLADTLERIRFAAPPVLGVRVFGDARDLQSFDVRFSLAAPGAETPWGSFNSGRLNARLFPARTNESARAELSIEAQAAGWTNAAHSGWAAATTVQLVASFASAPGETNWANAGLVIRAAQAATTWGSAQDLLLTLDAAPVFGQTNLMDGKVDLSAVDVQTPWAAATNAHFTAQWRHSLTNPIPLSGEGHLFCEQAATEWGRAGQLQFTSHLADAAVNPPAPPEAAWGWWTNLQPYLLDWEAQLTDVKTPRLTAERLAGRGSWRAPDLAVTNLQAALYQGRFDAHANLNVATRSVRTSFESDVDPRRISPLLLPEEPRWLAACAWETPPEIKVEASLVLPSWTNRLALRNWRTEAQPSLVLLGEINFARGAAYNGASLSTAHSRLIYSNLFWQLPDLLVTRPEGRIQAGYEASDVSGNYYWRVSSTINPTALRPIFATNQQPAVDYFTFTEPPIIDAVLQGNYREPERVGARGRLALTNFTFRGQWIGSFSAAFQYTNRVLEISEPRIQRGTQQLNAASVTVDFRAEKIFITNGFSTTEPDVVARAIGPHIVRIMEPYRFTRPPTVRGHGVLPIHGEEAADFYFDLLDGGEFRWWKFRVDQIAARIHWRSQHLTIADVKTDFYGGQANGSAAFDFQPPNRRGIDYQFTLTTTNSFLQSLVADLFPGTNHLGGFLSGALRIASANSMDDHSAMGSGNVDLRDGLIWDFPVFGFLSPVMNSVAPGIGNSRASAATGSFTISNSVIHSDDLDIRTTGMRILYRGAVDLDGHVNARAEGRPLRDVPLVGPVVNTLLWPVTKLFEFKVTGTLSAPKTEPLFFLPKVVLFPFHPIRAFKDLTTEDTASSTNSVPLKSP